MGWKGDRLLHMSWLNCNRQCASGVTQLSAPREITFDAASQRLLANPVAELAS
eukprot:COSAG02_NODE_23565_length_715_cov_0.714286_1_plen_52_part_10